MNGLLVFRGMRIEVQEHRSDGGDPAWWLRRADTPTAVTVGVKRQGRPVAVANAFDIDPAELDAALAPLLET